MTAYEIKIEVLSDAAFGSGDGIAGFVDMDLEYDGNGFPMLKGKTLKGIMTERCDFILDCLRQYKNPFLEEYIVSRQRLFGSHGSIYGCIMHICNAVIPGKVEKWLMAAISQNRVTADEVENAITNTVVQTAVDQKTKEVKKNRLRTTRVLLHGNFLSSSLVFVEEPTVFDMELLTVSLVSIKGIGLAKTRGRGRVSVSLWDGSNEITDEYLNSFIEKVR
ncbi:hypothetical protein FWJ32_06675 [Calorimonas adulescens]|uniref:RAMP superfamily protein n=2 Tax=Calorimonas adulescens TaxID=2606906 RepID=A0A5D8QDE8_9THEO|nr:hypothetical protein FWJ32_06675 [Calorimonas adulescens]